MVEVTVQGCLAGSRSVHSVTRVFFFFFFFFFASVSGCVASTGRYTLQPVVEASVQDCIAGTGQYTL